MFIFYRVLCFHSPYHKTHVICLTRDKNVYHYQSNVPPQLVVCPPDMTAVTVRKEDRDHHHHHPYYHHHGINLSNRLVCVVPGLHSRHSFQMHNCCFHPGSVPQIFGGIRKQHAIGAWGCWGSKVKQKRKHSVWFGQDGDTCTGLGR